MQPRKFFKNIFNWSNKRRERNDYSDANATGKLMAVEFPILSPKYFEFTPIVSRPNQYLSPHIKQAACRPITTKRMSHGCLETWFHRSL